MPVPQRVDPTALPIQKAFVHTQTVRHCQNIICIIYSKLYFEGLRFQDALRKHSCLLLWCPQLCYTITKLIPKIKDSVMDPSLFFPPTFVK